MAKMYSVTIRNRLAGTVFALGIVGAGALLLTVGFALLAALLVAGGLLGVGAGVYRALRGRGQALPHAGIRSDRIADSELDPALEVRPDQPAIVRPRGEGAE
jgi:hypothetical protein